MAEEICEHYKKVSEGCGPYNGDSEGCGSYSGDYCMVEGNCIYGFRYQIDYGGSFGKTCKIQGIIPEEFLQNSQLEKEVN